MKRLLLLLALLLPVAAEAQWIPIDTGWQYIQVPETTVSGGGVTGGTCTNQVVTAIDTSGVPTCSSIVNAQITAATIDITKFAALAANSLVMNATAGSAVPTAIAIPACADSGGNHLNYSAGAFSCGTSGDGSGAPDPATVVQWTDDFTGQKGASATGVGGDVGGWLVSNSGTNAGASSAQDAEIDEENHPGVSRFDKGTTTTGVSSLNRFIASTSTFRELLFGTGTMYTEFDMCVSALSGSTANETYILREGFGDKVDGTAPVDGAWVEYTDTVNSGHWVFTTSSNSTPSTSNANVGPTVCPTYQKIRITGTSSSVSVLIDGVAAGTSAIATNIPSAAGREFGMQFSILGTGSAATQEYAHLFDYIKFFKTVSR